MMLVDFTPLAKVAMTGTITATGADSTADSASVARTLAALLVVEGKARLATAEEASEFRSRAAEAKAAADQLAAASKVQFTVLSDADFRALKSGKKG